MSGQAATGGANEGAPSLGDVRFEDDVLLTFDGTSWIQMARVADTETNTFLFRSIWPVSPSGSLSEARSDSVRSGTQAAGDDTAGTVGNDSAAE
jgi:hypothetical protein